MTVLVETKRLLVDYNKRYGPRKYKYRHNKRVRSIYVQVRRLEIAVWYWK